jgi:UDP-glucose 4-epimerase
MRVLVTGGSGAIGSYVVRELGAYGLEPVIIDQRAPASQAPQVPFVPCDLTSLTATLGAVRDADVVLHLAAIPNPNSDPLERVMTVNMASCFNVLEAVRRNGIPRIVYACSESSSGFGIHLVDLKPLYLPIDELHPCWPHESYSLSKRFGEEMVAHYAHAFGIEGIALRYTWVWTERDREGVRGIMRARRAGQGVTGLYGAFIAVEDVAQAFRLASTYRFPPAQQPPFEAFYLAAAETFNSAPTLECVAQRFDPLPEVRDPGYFAANPYATVFDTRKAQRLLGWQATRSWRDFLDW